MNTSTTAHARRPGRARRIGIAALLCSAAALTACSGGSSGASGSSPSSGGSGGSAQGGGAAGGQEGLNAVSAAYQKTVAAKTASFTTDTETMAKGKNLKIAGSGKLQFDPPAADYTVNIVNQPAEVRLVGGNAYVMVQGKWSKADSGQAGQLAKMSPAQSLELLRDSIGSATKTGEKNVNNAPATGYHVTLDLNKLAQSTKDDTIKKSVTALQAQLKSSTLPLDLYLDGQGRLVEQDQQLTIPSQNGQVSTKTHTTYSGFGAPVNIVAPKVG